MAGASYSSLLFSLSLLAMAMAMVGSSTYGHAAARKTVGMYELKKGDFSVKFTNWGATIVSVLLPDSKGELADVVLGYDTLGPYIANPQNFGALIGRVSGRIKRGRFVLNGTPYRLYRNDGNNTLHGGGRGFHHAIWTVQEIVDGETPSITFYYHSFDGEQGFPGALDVIVTYKITGNYELSISMEATPLNKATPVNLATHSYWNLAGQNSGTILSNSVQIFASNYIPVDNELIPTGSIAPVSGTPYDFLKPRPVGERIQEVSPGYNTNFVIDSPADEQGMRKAAIVKDYHTGRVLELWTDQVTVQLYTSNYLMNVTGKGGYVYGQYDALSLETQGYPDAVNRPNFPSQIVYPGETYRHNLLHKFYFE